MRTRSFFLGFCALLLAASGCNGGGSGSGAGPSDLPPIPASHDPKGADLVEGAVLAAVEVNGYGPGSTRLLKIVHVDDFPLPLDYEFHMIAYEPKGNSWEECARLWQDKDKKLKVIQDHFIVRKVDFMTRDYRVLKVEPVTPDERAPYEKSRQTMVPQR